MKKARPRKTRSTEIETLRRRLEEAEETLRAITSGEVDALVVSGDQGDQVFTLKDADRPYRTLVERMNEGALTLSENGVIVYCNSSFAEIVDLKPESIVGEHLTRWIVAEDQPKAQQLLKMGVEKNIKAEIRLCTRNRDAFPVQLSISALQAEGSTTLTAVVSDLRERHRIEQSLREVVGKLDRGLQELGESNEELRKANVQLESTRNELEAEQQRYLDLFNFAPDGYLITDHRGVIRQANQAAAAQLNVPPDQLVNVPILGFVDSLNRRVFLSRMAELGRLTAPKIADVIVKLHPRNGTPFVASIRIGAIPDSQGITTGLRWLIHDISSLVEAESAVRDLNRQLEKRVAERTFELQSVNFLLEREIEDRTRAQQQIQAELAERERAEETVEKLNKDLERRAVELEIANRELESFSYSVSHDLRTPLASIDGFSRLLLEENAGELSETGRRLLRLIHENAQAMRQLINDLLSFSRSSRVPLNKQTVAPSEIVVQVLDELRGTYGNRKVDVAIGDMPTCDADPNLLRQVYMNLLSNAVKFTRTRDVARIEIGCGNCDGERAAYFVRDNGVGFDPENASRLFSVFQRLHGEDEFEGNGVGLAIVERIIRRHGGRVWAEAEVDQGATFYFTLA